MRIKFDFISLQLIKSDTIILIYRLQAVRPGVESHPVLSS